jgi:hypothetical protein
MLRFCKQRLLMGSNQTPDVEHEENWVQLTLLAYIQLWAARNVAISLPRPWEKSHHKKTNHSLTPSASSTRLLPNYSEDWYSSYFFQTRVVFQVGSR